MRFASSLAVLFTLLPVPVVAGDAPVATVGGRPVSLAALEASVGPRLAQLDAERAALLEEGLRHLVADTLVAREAERVGTSVDALLRDRGGYVPPTDAEVEAWYRDNAARIRQPLDAVRGAVRDHLDGERRRAARDRLAEELRERYPVELHLAPYRVSLDDDGAAARGPATAPVTVTVFSDFECPWCRRLVPALEELERRFDGRVRLAFRHLPLTSIHPRAEPAALAAICADEQGRFWPYHDLLFGDGSSLEESGLRAAATAAGLELDAWTACRAAPATRDRLAADLATAARLGLSGTPVAFVNGRPVPFLAGREPLDLLAEVVADELAR